MLKVDCKNRGNLIFKNYVIIFLILLSGVEPQAQGQGVKKAFYDSVSSPWVWAPTGAALALFLSDQDGKVTDFASDHRPIFGSVESAKTYSDIITFGYFPAVATLTTGMRVYQNEPRSYWKYPSFLASPAATYGVNVALKNGSGRIRPDSSNDLSFPSAHTSLASAMSHTTDLNMRHSSIKKHAKWFTIINEMLVVSVAWARMEARKHHATDVLVGYSLGRFFSGFVNRLIFEEQADVKIMVISEDRYYAGMSWNF